MAIPRILYRVRRQSTTLPLSHMAARCTRGSSHSGISAAGWRSAEDGDVRHVALQSRLVSRAIAPQRTLDHCACHRRHHLWSSGGHGAAQHEEADRIFLDQPSRVRRARHLQFHTSRTGRRCVCDAGARSFHGRTIHAGGNFVRTAAYV